MNKRINIIFLILIVTQAIHSIEEYFGRLWEVYAPAKFICSLISSNLRIGFLIISVFFISISLLYWWSLVQRKSKSPPEFIWLWIILETINIIGHISWTVYEKSYTPGIITAIILLIVVSFLSKQLISANSASTKAGEK